MIFSKKIYLSPDIKQDYRKYMRMLIQMKKQKITSRKLEKLQIQLMKIKKKIFQ